VSLKQNIAIKQKLGAQWRVLKKLTGFKEVSVKRL
jgi:hypothetical protein